MSFLFRINIVFTAFFNLLIFCCSAYKKLLIGANGAINEIFFNTTIQSPTECGDLFDIKPCEPSEENDALIDNIEALSSLDEYENSVVDYVSGFIGKKVALQQRCDKCFKMLLTQNKTNLTLISKKETYCLLHPRKEIVQIVKKCEKGLKSLSKNDFLKKNCFKKLRIQLTHSFFPAPIDFFSEMKCNHLFDVVKMIVQKYLFLRFKHFAKLHNQQNDSVRHKYNKLIHFKGQ